MPIINSEAEREAYKAGVEDGAGQLEEVRCKDCKFWLPLFERDTQRNWGQCSYVIKRLDMLAYMIAGPFQGQCEFGITAMYPPQLITHSRFGCVAGERKDA